MIIPLQIVVYKYIIKYKIITRLEVYMPQTMQGLMQPYVSNVRAIYGSHLRQIILYGSYARGDYNSDSDVDVMILLDLSDMDIKCNTICN